MLSSLVFYRLDQFANISASVGAVIINPLIKSFNMTEMPLFEN